jgi:hypothetical protein
MLLIGQQLSVGSQREDVGRQYKPKHPSDEIIVKSGGDS